MLSGAFTHILSQRDKERLQQEHQREAAKLIYRLTFEGAAKDHRIRELESALASVLDGRN